MSRITRPGARVNAHSDQTGKPPSAHVSDQAAAKIPAELRAKDRWIVWQWWFDPNQRKWKKPPVDIEAPRNNCFVRDCHDGRIWLSFETARQAARSRGDGIGYVPDFGEVIIDIDHCVDPNGTVSSEITQILDSLDSYAEISPRGEGIHIVIRAQKPLEKTVFSGIEVYDVSSKNRYLTFTGNHLKGTPCEIKSRQEALNALFPKVGEKTTTGGAVGPLSGQGSSLTDEEIIIKARKRDPEFGKLFDGHMEGRNASSADMALMNKLAFWFGRDAERMERVFSSSALGIRSKWKSRGDYRERTILKAIEDCRSVYSPSTRHDRSSRMNGEGANPPGGNGDRKNLRPAEPGVEDDRPIILVTPDEFLVNDQAVAALAKDDAIFQRSFKLVSVVQESKPEGKRPKVRRVPGTPIIAELHPPRLRELLTRNARFHKRIEQGDDAIEKPRYVPGWCVNAVFYRQEWLDIRHLEGIVETPILLEDGSIIERPGYHRETGLLFVPNGDFLKLPERVSKNDAIKAVDELLGIVEDFPFKPGHQAAWLAALLTPLARHAIDGPCPLFLFDANVSGSGKSKLCDIIAILATGREMTRTAYTDDDAEMDKRITSIARAGDRLVMFDNLRTGAALGGPSLDRALTARTYQGRILGKTEMTGELPLNAVFFASGNNLGLKDDALRRVVPSRLETDLERPEERQDFQIKGDLLKHVQENRERFVRSALIILKAYVNAGRPDARLKPMDYPAWCAVVRNAVHWATGVDPCRSREEYVAEDTRLTVLAAVLRGLLSLPDIEKGLTVAEILRTLDDGNRPEYQALRDALADWARKGPLPTSVELGVRFRASKGKPVNGLRLKALGDDNRACTMRWTVAKVSE